MEVLGESFEGELVNGAYILWSDGEIWTRRAGAAPPPLSRQDSTQANRFREKLLQHAVQRHRHQRGSVDMHGWGLVANDHGWVGDDGVWYSAAEWDAFNGEDSSALGSLFL